MSSAGIFNWPCDTRGDTLQEQTFKNIRDENGPIDISEASIRMQVRDKRGKLMADLSEPLNIEKGQDNSSFTVKPFRITNGYGMMSYDIQFTFPGNVVETWIKGEIELIRDTTYD